MNKVSKRGGRKSGSYIVIITKNAYDQLQRDQQSENEGDEEKERGSSRVKMLLNYIMQATHLSFAITHPIMSCAHLDLGQQIQPLGKDVIEL